MSYGYSQDPVARRGLPPSRKQEIKSKIDQIMHLCHDENTAVNRDLNSLIQAEKGVHELLQQTEPAAPSMSGPISTPIPSTITPIRPVKEDLSSQLHQDIGSIIRKNSHVFLNEEALRLID